MNCDISNKVNTEKDVLHQFALNTYKNMRYPLDWNLLYNAFSGTYRRNNDLSNLQNILLESDREFHYSELLEHVFNMHV